MILSSFLNWIVASLEEEITDCISTIKDLTSALIKKGYSLCSSRIVIVHFWQAEQAHLIVTMGWFKNVSTYIKLEFMYNNTMCTVWVTKMHAYKNWSVVTTIYIHVYIGRLAPLANWVKLLRTCTMSLLEYTCSRAFSHRVYVLYLCNTMWFAYRSCCPRAHSFSFTSHSNRLTIFISWIPHE